MSSGSCRWVIARSLLVVVGAIALALWSGHSALADQAPFWESPVGLVPGNPNSQVTMAAENVDVRIVERDDEIRAEVTATFDMVNDGPAETLKVGFPASTVSLFDDLAEPDATGRRQADAPVMFSPQSLRAFRVSVDGQELRSWRQDVPAAAQAGFGADWLMWEMTYPAGQAVRVEVSYEQVLTERPGQPVVQPMYVLRTGALWAGPIGDAVVTFSAPDGGAFVGGPELFSRSEADGSTTGYPRADQVYGPYGVAGSSPTRIAWRFHDFEPKGDVGATYVRSGPWKRYLDADGVLLFHVRPSAPELQEAAASALAILTGSLHCGRPAGAACIEGPFGVSRSLVGHLADGMRVNIRRAVELAPDDAMTQLTYGDVEFWWAMPWRKHHGELGCWPTRAADAYERAVELGASDAAARLDDLRVAARQTRVYPDGRLFTCSRQGDTRLDVELIKATIEHGNSAWAAGVGRGGSADWYRAYFAGDWLAERQAEVADLRASGRYRDAHPTGIEIGDVTLNGDGTATADATEQWDDKTYASDRSLVRDASGTLRQRYQLQYLDDQWKIVGATIIRP